MSTTGPLEPHPLSWRTRTVRAILALLLFVVALRLGWGAYADHLLQSQLADLRRRGEPTTLAELAPEPSSADNAAFTLQQQATQSLSQVESPSASSLEFRPYPPFGPQWTKLATASESANAAAMRLARQARTQPGAAPPSAGPGAFSGSPYNSLRQLANTLGDGALFAHVHGNDAEAIERVRDVLHLARSLHRQPIFISQLVADGIDALAYNRILVLAPALRIADDRTTTPPATGPASPATRRQVQDLIAELLDDRPFAANVRLILQAGRLSGAEAARSRSSRTWFIRPAATLVEVCGNQNYDLMTRAAATHLTDVEATLAQCRWPLAQARPSYLTLRRSDAPPSFSLIMFNEYAPYDRYFDVSFRLLADRRIAATALAIRLYRADHDGRFPTTLAQLVPAYLASVPEDPLAPAGQAIGYRILPRALPDGADRPVLYAGSPDWSDLGPPDEPAYDRYRDDRATRPARDTHREYRDLTRFTPPGAPSPEAVEHAVDEPGAPRY
jgi:hypothetical protein